MSSVAVATSFTENGAAVTASPSLSVADADNLTLVSATVSVGNGFAGDGDVLGFSTAGTSITGSYNSATETLVLSGVDTVAHYQSVLDSVTFSTPSDNPTNYGSSLSRVLTWVVNDGSASSSLSAPQFTTVVVTAINDAPTLANAPAVKHAADRPYMTIAPGASVVDPDSQTLANATVKITGGTFAGDGDVLAANVAGTSITASYNAATETLTLDGLRHARALPAGARQRHVLVRGQPDQFRGQPDPHADLDAQRRRRLQQPEHGSPPPSRSRRRRRTTSTATW